jgi:gluconolactonase
MSFVNVDLLALARDATYFTTLPATNINLPAISLLSYHPDFQTVLGENATARKIADLPWPAFHEAGIYNKKDNSLYVTSNYESLADNINITVVSLDDYSFYSTQFPDVWEANGGTSYYPPGSDQTQTPPQQVYCDEGDFEHYSQLVAVDPNTKTSEVLLTSFLGRNFSSVKIFDNIQSPETSGSRTRTMGTSRTSARKQPNPSKYTALSQKQGSSRLSQMASSSPMASSFRLT